MWCVITLNWMSNLYINMQITSLRIFCRDSSFAQCSTSKKKFQNVKRSTRKMRICAICVQWFYTTYKKTYLYNT